MTIRRSMSRDNGRAFPHRCVKCEHRKTLRRLWSLYVRPPRCESCGHYRLYPCRDRLASRNRKRNCHCSGYWFIHRRGSKWCERNPNIEHVHETQRREMRRRAA